MFFSTCGFFSQVQDLKDLCKSMGLSVSGKKQDLVDRLMEYQQYQQSKSAAASSSGAGSAAAMGRNYAGREEDEDFEPDEMAEMDSDWDDSGPEELYAERTVRTHSCPLQSFALVNTRKSPSRVLSCCACVHYRQTVY
jgi:hypothetical protein